jgi:hypothetical protein
MSRRMVLLGSTVLALTVSGFRCGGTPAISEMTVTPSRLVCPGDPVTVSWRASGPVTVHATGGASGVPTGRQSATGSFTANVTSSAHFTVALGTSSLSRGPVEVAGVDRSAYQVSANTGCSCGSPPGWTVTLTDAEYSDRLVVGEVQGDLPGFEVSAEKDGLRTPPLRAFTSSANLAGVRFNGTWALHRAVAFGEGCRCQTATGAILNPGVREPGPLSVGVQVRCEP